MLVNPDIGSSARVSRPRNRKELILRAASEHFLREGYHRTSMADIATTVGITSTALYRHFRNKNELLERCVLDALDLTAARIAEAGTLDELIDALIRVVLDQRGVSALWQREARYLTDETRADIWHRVLAISERVRAMLVPARTDLDEQRVELLSWCLMAIFDSVSHHRVVLPRDRFEDLLREMARSVVGASMISMNPPRPIEPIIPDPAENYQLSRRERLLGVATRLFSERGYAAVSIDDIGAAAGITGPSVYYHFKSKSHLLAELVNYGAKATEHYTALAAAETATPRGVCEALANYYISFATAQPDLSWAAVSELTHLPADEARKHRDRQRAGIMRWIGSLLAMRPELDAAEARVVVQAVLMIVNDVVRIQQLRREPVMTSELSAICSAVQAPNAPAR